MGDNHKKWKFKTQFNTPENGKIYINMVKRLLFNVLSYTVEDKNRYITRYHLRCVT